MPPDDVQRSLDITGRSLCLYGSHHTARELKVKRFFKDFVMRVTVHDILSRFEQRRFKHV
jgi:hypothetical protein